MEKADYRINLEMLMKMFPDRASISTQECAKILNCSDKSVRSAIKRRINPLPAVKVTPKMYAIAIPSFARWLSDIGR